MQLGDPIAYAALESGTPVYSADGEPIGKVAHVLAAEDKDVFDGIVIGQHVFGASTASQTPTTSTGSMREAPSSSLTRPRASTCRSPRLTPL